MTTFSLQPLVDRATAASQANQRTIIGLTGSPGSGKTTIAKLLVHAINAQLGAGNAHYAVHLPMDGFHLANDTLHKLGIHHRKGAIDTFDGWGYLALLNRIQNETSHVVYAPEFDRNFEEGIAGHIEIHPETRLVITEGNYLLIDREPWASTREVAAEIWFCATPEAERVRRLISRHQQFGMEHEPAEQWAINVDGANAKIIEPTKARADLIISGESGEILK